MGPAALATLYACEFFVNLIQATEGCPFKNDNKRMGLSLGGPSGFNSSEDQGYYAPKPLILVVDSYLNTTHAVIR